MNAVEFAQFFTHSPRSPAGLSRGSRLHTLGAILIGMAGTSPAMTPSVWFDLGDTTRIAA
jgi:hypothetical protein